MFIGFLKEEFAKFLQSITKAMKGLYFIVNVCFFTWLVVAAQNNGNIMSQNDQCPRPWTR